MPKPRGKDLISLTGISSGYAYDILSGRQPPSRPLAIYIYRKTGWKHGCLDQYTEKQLKQLEEIEPWERAA